MKFLRISLVALFAVAFAIDSFAQRDPKEMALREKQNLYRKVADLSDDQKLLLDGIYDEFGTSIKEMFDEVRKTRKWETLRTKMGDLRKEKDDLISDVLNEDQYDIYFAMVEKDREARRKRMEQRQGQRPQTQPQKSDSTDTKKD